MELFEQVPELDAVIVPVGGGGLLSGMTLAYRELNPAVRMFAAEPLGADDAYRSKQAGELILQTGPDTIADGLLTSLGERTWPVIRDCVEEVICVDDDQIRQAMRLMWERMKTVIEPSAATAVAVALSPTFQQRPEMARVGVLLTGGNVDLEALPWMQGSGSDRA